MVTGRIVGDLSMTTARPLTNYPRLRPRLASAVVALILITPVALAAQPLTPKPLPAPVQSQAPGIRPLGRGRQTVMGHPRLRDFAGLRDGPSKFGHQSRLGATLRCVGTACVAKFRAHRNSL